MNADFSLTGKLAVSASLPFIDGKYIGSSPHFQVRGEPDTEVAVDNGKYHGTFQDFRFNVRYALRQGALKIVPFFQATIPSHDYATLGHAAVGFDEREYRMGVSVGRRLNPLLPNAFVQAQYAFGLTPEVAANIAPKRSYGELQLGYLLNRHISVQGSSVLTYSHTGINLDYNLFPNNLTDEQYLNHDRIARGEVTGRQRLGRVFGQQIHECFLLDRSFVLRRQYSSALSGGDGRLHQGLQHQAPGRKDIGAGGPSERQ